MKAMHAQELEQQKSLACIGAPRSSMLVAQDEMAKRHEAKADEAKMHKLETQAALEKQAVDIKKEHDLAIARQIASSQGALMKFVSRSGRQRGRYSRSKRAVRSGSSGRSPHC